MRIAILVEGKTEKIFKPILISFINHKLEIQNKPKPKLQFISSDGRIAKGEKLKRQVEALLSGTRPCDAVIALTDVYTGTKDFKDAADAKAKMNQWVGENPKFYPHVAQYDFEAWLLPFWSTIQRISGGNRGKPKGAPETVNHDRPPSYHIKEIFEQGKKRSYSKTRDGAKILKNQNLMDAIQVCPELKAFISTIFELCDGKLIDEND